MTRRHGLLAVLLVVSAIGVGVTAPARAAAPARTAEPGYQLGINSFVTYDCQGYTKYMGWAATQLSGFKSLGANAVALAFPIYTNSLWSSRVYPALDCASSAFATPPLALLRRVIALAHEDGLSVLLRPLVSLVKLPPHKWRGEMEPTNVTLWMSSYFQTLRPYLALAQSMHVEHFAIASELDSLATRGSFQKVVNGAKEIYRGDLVVTFTWTSPFGKLHWDGTSDGVDTYPAIANPSPTQTPQELLDAWDYLLQANPQYRLPVSASQETIDEIGIMAQDGAYAHPLTWRPQPFNQDVQANWFTAACLFMTQHQMHGIYYWGDWMAAQHGNLLASPSPSHPLSLQPAAQQAIKQCFTSISGQTLAG